MSSAPVLNASEPQSIQKAVDILRKGGLVAFPTETVYGLGADAFNEKAVCRIFEAKKRPTFDPLIVHVASPDEALKLWSETPKLAKELMKAFWPGPFTLVLPKSPVIPDIVTSGLPTVAVRMPRNDAALSLIKALGRPIAAPSANLFGYTSPTSARHVSDDLGDKVDLVLDGGPAAVGVESTVVKVEAGRCILLRPGAVTAEQLEAFAPVSQAKASVVESPGQMDVHYAPWTPLFLLPGSWEECGTEVGELLEKLRQKKQSPLRTGLLSLRPIRDAVLFESVQPLSEEGDLQEAASKLFHALRKLDKMHLDILLAEPVPDKGIGAAILDRLRKASGGKRADARHFEEF